LARRVQITKGVMLTTRGDRRTTDHLISSSDTQPREVIIEHPREPGWKLEGESKPVETTPEVSRYVVKVDAKQSAKLQVEESSAEKSSFALGAMPRQQIQFFIEHKEFTPELR
jgi:hypothetical protein